MIDHERRKWLIDRTKFWLWQAFISLLAAYISTQHWRHGTLAVRPSAGDIGPTLIAFAIIFAAVIGVTHLAARFNDEGEPNEVGGGGER
jgi:hypothetical protein